MKRIFWTVLFVPAFAWAGPIGYAQASGYFKKDTRPTLHQPLNLLDGREATAYCTSSADPLNDHLTVGFKGPVRLEELRVYTGNGFDESTWKEFSRAQKLSIKGPSGAQAFTVADQRGLQSITLDPPLEGAQFQIEILDQYEAEDPDQPVCLTDVIFVSDGKPLNGPWLTQKLKYDKDRALVLGTWFGGYVGAPDHYLSFFFDGTYRYVYDPYDKATNKPKELKGDYSLSHGRLSLEVPGKGRVSARVSVSKDGKTRTLSLEGDLPADLRQKFRDAQ